jgi:hypothetical protein
MKLYSSPFGFQVRQISGLPPQRTRSTPRRLTFIFLLENQNPMSIYSSPFGLFGKVIFLCSLFYGSVCFSGIRYEVQTNLCPKSHVQHLINKIKRSYDEHQSLYDLKKQFLSENWSTQYFLSFYKIEYFPFVKKVAVQLDCSQPLFRVHFKQNSHELYEKTLAENGQLYDPNYEYLYYKDQDVPVQLSYLTIDEKHRENKIFFIQIKNLVKTQKVFFQKYIAEAIFDEGDSLTFIIRHSQGSSVAYLGKSDWNKKLHILKKMMMNFEMQGQIPVLMNVSNLKKVVVKFTLHS